MPFPEKPTLGSIHALTLSNGKRGFAVYDESGWRVFAQVWAGTTPPPAEDGVVTYDREVHLARRVLGGPEKL